MSGRPWGLVSLCTVAVLTAGGCTAQPGPDPVSPPAAASATGPPATPASPAGPPAPPPCPPTAELPVADGLPERQGVAHGGTLWALFFPRERRLRAGTEVKIVWRMTGGGGFSIDASGPDGATVLPVWGPQAHGGSSWRRPGGEWGTGWVFPAKGCWTFTARSGDAVGRLTVRVA